MAKTPKNQNKSWTKAEVSKLRKLAQSNTPTGLIADELDRSVPAVRSKASEENISLRPTNKPPYNRKKK